MADAKRWLSEAGPDENFAQIQYHWTTAEGEQSMRTNGIDVLHSAGGQFGRGFYTTDSEAGAAGAGFADRRVQIAVRGKFATRDEFNAIEDSLFDQNPHATDDEVRSAVLDAGFDGLAFKKLGGDTPGATWAIVMRTGHARLVDPAKAKDKPEQEWAREHGRFAPEAGGGLPARDHLPAADEAARILARQQPQLSELGRRGLRHWAGDPDRELESKDVYKATNRTLRGQTLNPAQKAVWERVQPAMDALRDDVARNEVPDSVVVSRATKGMIVAFKKQGIDLRNPEAVVGKTFTDPGMVSTTPIDDANLGILAAQFGGIGADKLHVVVPKGAKGLYINATDDYSEDYTLKELILAAGSTFRVRSVEHTPERRWGPEMGPELEGRVRTREHVTVELEVVV
jgi:hypothetical protein